MNTDEGTQVKNAQSSKPRMNRIPNDEMAKVMRNPWDPLHSSDWDECIPTTICLRRIQREISSMLKESPPGMFIDTDPDNITKIHALIIGPSDTPYENGFFYFIIRCPPNYPFQPPRCRFMTTANSTVRMNPNLYQNGKVCVSILGTMTGPSWAPTLTLESLILSIQSLLSENPYHNAPGFTKERRLGDSKAYNETLKHETLRVAVCEMLETTNVVPQQLREIMIKHFLKFYDFYIDECNKNIDKDGQQMIDPFNKNCGLFQYSSLLTRLQQLKYELESNKCCNEEEQKSDFDINQDISSSINIASDRLSDCSIIADEKVFDNERKVNHNQDEVTEEHANDIQSSEKNLLI
ncbi:unnamed protein product [Rotaria socialis]|uniref:Ubiquitin-conjugating enzyme E2 Z n=1 Tax=Rotaria socialis TaxID=392032 RepID=A0A818GFX6_9BILA|nr:unnamed protein product [Rotaria socialis]CAF3489686.1 unnamed protein product [Rotaria socialis]CAF3587982.1 unnamed protein product [Rotaria socialis]CAF3645432.1 unnamed protein product [Rotaria socialis]CAF4305739.1 unnamed protein product [Rotaria socialis]